MCLAKAYVSEGAQNELIMEDIALVTWNGDKLQLSTLFGERTEIEGTVKEIDFQSGNIIVERSGSATA